ncbi:MAG: homoserine kinase [Candidatus Marinimicrobia bacterium]|nr:homoserine kinase [Candidatus Neomarinimicrobiota bacterium]
MVRRVRAFGPASIANAVAGFDVLGFALDEPGDVVICSLSEKAGIRIAPMTGAFQDLPTDPDKNTAGVAVQSLLKKHGIVQGIEIEIQKGVPIMGGMGSSASSASAALVAVNELLELKCTKMDLLPFILDSERAATGVPHADNAAPSLLGGFNLIQSLEPLQVLALDIPPNIFCSVVHPHMYIKTRDAREILPHSIPMAVATKQMGHIAGFIAGMQTGDLDIIKRSLVDELAEPHRSKLIPGYWEVKQATEEAGALGCGISGSGPSMFALSQSEEIAKQVALSMQKAFSVAGLKSDLYISGISKLGARILD